MTLLLSSILKSRGASSVCAVWHSRLCAGAFQEPSRSPLGAGTYDVSVLRLGDEGAVEVRHTPWSLLGAF